MHKPWYSHLYVKSPIAKIIWGILAVLLMLALVLVLGVIEEDRMQAQSLNWEGRRIEKGAEIFVSNCSACHGMNGEGGAGPALNSKYFFTQRLADVGFAGTLYDYIELTVASGRPSKVDTQWSVMMPTWSSRYGGPLRDDQTEQVARYVMNWETQALEQTADEDPWIPFEDTPTTVVPTGDEIQGDADAGAVQEPRAPSELFVSMGCIACHNLDEIQTDSNRGPVGPNMGNLAENASTRVSGQLAQEYVHNSIVSPNSHVVDGYFPNIMPQTFAEQMTEEEINSLVNWLLDPGRQQ